MNINKLKHVVAVDRAGTMSGAAVALNITQSTVTKSVADVENELGYLVFDRRARGVVATDEGREFISRASRIIADLDLLVADARAQHKARDAIFRIGVCPASLEGLVNRAVRRLIEVEPSLRIHMSALSVERGIRLLHRGDIEVLIGPEQSVGRESEFEAEALGSMCSSLFARKDHPLTRKSCVTLEDFADYIIIAPDLVNTHTDRLRRLYTSCGKDPARFLHIIDYFPLVSEIVASSDFLALTSKGYGMTQAFRKRFVAFDADVFDPMPLCVAYRARWLPNRATRFFVAALKAFPPTGLPREDAQI